MKRDVLNKLAEHCLRWITPTVCQLCVERLIYGSKHRSENLTDSFLTKIVNKSFPHVCPFCCGLLELDGLCKFPANISNNELMQSIHDDELCKKYILVHVLRTLSLSEYKFTGLQLQVTEPINISVREQLLWLNFENLKTSAIPKHIIDEFIIRTENDPTTQTKLHGSNEFLFNQTDISYWRGNALPVKAIWKCLVESVISDLLKVPMVYSFRSDADLDAITDTTTVESGNQLGNKASGVVCVHLEFTDPNARLDQDLFQEILETSNTKACRKLVKRLDQYNQQQRRKFRKRRRSSNILSKPDSSSDLSTNQEQEQEMKEEEQEQEVKQEEPEQKVKQEEPEQEVKQEEQQQKVKQEEQEQEEEELEFSNPTDCNSLINLTYSKCGFPKNIICEALVKLPPKLFDSLLSQKFSRYHQPCFLHAVHLKRPVPLVLAGRYVKLSRTLPQSPWIIYGSIRKLDSSVEELISNPIKAEFGPKCSSVFISAGREDIDVRCLGLGRPFILELNDYASLASDILTKWSDDGSIIDNNNTDNKSNGDGFNSRNLNKLARYINSTTENKVFIRDLQFVFNNAEKSLLKSAESKKPKCYRALCWCPDGGLNTELLQSLAVNCTQLKSSTPSCDICWIPASNTTTTTIFDQRIFFGSVLVTQLTPIRVLHRRTHMVRPRTIESFSIMPYPINLKETPELADFENWTNLYPREELFFLELKCEAGTYVKEFVHGDLGRCKPSLASMLKRQVDILALDVIAVELNWPQIIDNP